MQGIFRQRVLLASLLVFSCASSRGVDRGWRWTPGLVATLDELDACPGCSAAADDADVERYQPLAPREDDLLKRTRKNFVTMKETCECTIDYNKWNERNLSKGHYPATVYEINCTAHSCSDCHRPHVCSPHLYSMKVLAEKESKDDADGGVPDDIKERYKFVKVPISIGCKCTKMID